MTHLDWYEREIRLLGASIARDQRRMAQLARERDELLRRRAAEAAQAREEARPSH